MYRSLRVSFGACGSVGVIDPQSNNLGNLIIPDTPNCMPLIVALSLHYIHLILFDLLLLLQWAVDGGGNREKLPILLAG